jgi:hypothetical protein
MLVILSMIYMLCGYVVGYYQGYQEAIEIKVEK